MPLLVFVSISLLSLAAGAVAFGAQRAMRIAGAAVLNVVLDGLAERPVAHRIPVLDLEVASGALDSLNADLPWSGNVAQDAVLVQNGIRYKTKYRYRGLVATTHYLGGKKSFRLNLKKDNPFAPYRRLNFINPKTNNLLNCHLAYWMAGRMGVAVPHDELVFVRLNGRDHGVHEMFEQMDGGFERARHLVDHDVPVFKGDYPPATGREWPQGRALWRDAANWAYVSDADSAQAHARLKALIAVINAVDMDDRTRIDSLARLVDVEAYVRFYAALKVMHTMHIDNYHNQWLVLSPRSGRFYPVLWDPLLLFATYDPYYPIHDALEFWLMKDPALRLRRDQHIHEALTAFVADSAFDRHMDALEERILPSVLADRNKHGQVTDQAEDVLRFSALHWAGSCARLRRELHAHWRNLIERMRVDGLEVRREGDVLVANWHSDATIGYSVPDSLTVDPMGMKASVIRASMPGDEATHLIVEPEYPVGHSLGDKADPFKDAQYWVAPRELRLKLNGSDPSRIHFINLTTGESIETGN